MTLQHMTISDLAQAKIREKLIQYQENNGIYPFISIDIKQRGCSGLSYDMQIVTSTDEKDFIIKEHNVCIKPKAFMWTINTTLDYETNDANQSFVFKNPNQKKLCHCGEAFYT